MRALYKAISVPRARRASSKGGGCYSSQSGSGWDEYTKRVTSECLNWMRQQKVNLKPMIKPDFAYECHLACSCALSASRT